MATRKSLHETDQSMQKIINCKDPTDLQDVVTVNYLNGRIPATPYTFAVAGTNVPAHIGPNGESSIHVGTVGLPPGTWTGSTVAWVQFTRGSLGWLVTNSYAQTYCASDIGGNQTDIDFNVISIKNTGAPVINLDLTFDYILVRTLV